jgi:hypothetical protein
MRENHKYFFKKTLEFFFLYFLIILLLNILGWVHPAIGAGPSQGGLGQNWPIPLSSL